MTHNDTSTHGFVPDLLEANRKLRAARAERDEYKAALKNVVNGFTNDNVDRNTVFRWTSALAEAAELLRRGRRR